jgi:hypothetical protein
MDEAIYESQAQYHLFIYRVPSPIPCPGKAGIRLGCTSVKTLETDAMPGHGIALISPFNPSSLIGDL